MIHPVPFGREIGGIVSRRISLRLHLLQYLDTVLRERADLGRVVAQQSNAVVPKVLDDLCWQCVISCINRRPNRHVRVYGIQAPILFSICLDLVDQTNSPALMVRQVNYNAEVRADDPLSATTEAVRNNRSEANGICLR